VSFPVEDLAFRGTHREGRASSSHDFFSVGERQLSEGQIILGDVVALDLSGSLEPGLHEVARLDFTLLGGRGATGVEVVEGRFVEAGLAAGPVLVGSPAGVTPSPIETVKSIELHVIPNPFSGATTIRYGVPSSGRVRVDIYSVSGRLVRRLVDRVEKAGRYEAVWNGKNDKSRGVPPGIYFCKVSTPGAREIRKVVVTK
jgi:hypothetical protein